MEAASDDVVTELSKILNRRITLSNLIDLRVLDVLERSTALSFKLRIRGRLSLGRLLHGSSACSSIESTLLQDCTLINFLDLEPIVKVFCVEDPLSILCELVSQKSSLLAAVAGAHVV